MSYGLQNLAYMREITDVLNNNAVAPLSGLWRISDPPLFKCVITVGGSGQQDEALKKALKDLRSTYNLRIERVNWLLSLWCASWVEDSENEPSSNNIAYFRVVIELLNNDRDIITKWKVVTDKPFGRDVMTNEYAIFEPCIKEKMEELLAKYILSVEKINWLLSVWQPVEG